MDIPARIDDLQIHNFEAIAKEGCFLYVYLRSRDSEYGPYKALTPYYVGKAARAQRVFERHSCAVPKDKRFAQVLKKGLTEEEANFWECHYISVWGRIDIGTGFLRNLTNGGEGVSGRIPSEDQIRRTNAAKAKNKSEEYGFTIEEWNALAQDEKTSIRRQANNAEKYGYTLQTWRALTDDEIHRIKAEEGQQMAAAAARYGLTIEEWCKLPQIERNDFPKLIKTAEKNGYTFQKWMNLTNAKRQSIGKQTATAARLNFPLHEWLVMTKSQKTVYIRQLKIADKYDYSFEEWRALSHPERMKIAAINRAKKAAANFGLDVELWIELTYLQREKIRDRYNRGSRLPELIKNL